MKGWIYKIVQIKSDDIPWMNGMCYVGQHRNSPLKNRWNSHKRSAKKYDPTKKGRGSKFAKLHQAMQNLGGVDYFELKELKTFEHSDENKLIDLLNQAEDKFINEFNSIKNGWNIVNAPKTNYRRNSSEKSLSQVANDNKIAYTSLCHRVNKMGESIEDAIKHLKLYANKNKEKYEYKRQIFNTVKDISESKLHNKYDLDKKTIERRIRNLKESKLKIKINGEKNEKIFVLIDEIFNPIRKYDEYTVTPPEGDCLNGLIVDLHKILFKRYPDLVPEKYTTIQSRLKKANWNVQQAFGFEYPPDLIDVKPLIESQGYKWAVKKPNFIRQNGKPVIMHSVKEIFSTQEEFCDQFGFKEDLVSDHLEKGKTPEEVRDYFWGKNN